MIRITRGVVGWDGRPLTSRSGDVELPSDVERDLVEKGVAEYVGKSVPEPPKPKQERRPKRRPKQDEEEPPVIEAAGVE